MKWWSQNHRWASGLILLLTPVYYLTPWDRIPGINVALGIPFLFLYAVILPGFVIEDRIASRKSDILEQTTAATLFGLTVFLIAAFVFALAHLSLGTFEKTLPGILVLVAILGLIRGEPRRLIIEPTGISGRLWAPLFTVFLLLIFILVLRSGIPLGFTADSLDHVGYVSEISETENLFPQTAFYMDPGSNGEDLRKGLLHVFYGFGCFYLGVESLALLNLINAFFAVVMLLTVYATGLHFFGNRAIAVISAVLFVLAVDEGLRDSMIRQSFYSHRFGMVFFLFVLVHGLRYLKNGIRGDLLPSALFAFAACATHVFFGVLVGFAGLTMFVWKFCFPQNNVRIHTGRILALGAAVAIGIVPYALFRYFTAFPEANELHKEVQGVVFVTQNLYIADPIQVFRWFGPIGLVSLLTMIPLWRDREKYPGLGYVFAAYLTVVFVVFNPILLPPIRNAMTYLIARLNHLCPFYFATAFFLVTFARSNASSDRSGVFRKLLVVLLALAVLDGAAPVITGNTFAPSSMRSERDESYLIWHEELTSIAKDIPPRAVIASDPLTSYSVAAFTPHYVVCTFDQHAPPNDILLEERMRAVRDILSPYVPMNRTTALLEQHRATHVVLNNRFPSDLRLEYWSMNREVFPDVRRKFELHRDTFEKLIDKNDFVVFRWNGGQITADEATSRSFVLDEPPAGITVTEKIAGEATLRGFAISEADATPGGVIEMSLLWSGDGPYAFKNYVVAVRLDHVSPELPSGGKPFPKIVRKFKQRFTGRLYRVSAYHKIRGGFLNPDSWREGDLIFDETRVRLPLTIVPGEYAVSVKLMSVTHQPTYRLRDFFYDDDVYQGIPIGRITIE